MASVSPVLVEASNLSKGIESRKLPSTCNHLRFQHADGLVLRLDGFLLRAEQGLKVLDFMAQLLVFHDKPFVVFSMEWGSGAALPEGIEGDAEEVGQRLQFREADVLGATEVGHGLLALLEEPGDEPLLLLAR